MSMILVRSGITDGYECLTASELYDVPVAAIPIQSTTFVYDTAKLYYLDTDRVWKAAGSATEETE